MDEDNKQIIDFYKKRIEPFVAVFILAFLIVGCVLLYQDNVLKEEIAENCGYETKKITCYCEQKIVDEQMQKQGGGIGNVEMDWYNNSEGFD